jgi:ribonuclease HI
MSDTATVHIDGAARGNPGPAAYALVLRRPGLPDVEESDTLGKATNNVAEYTGLIRGLERAIELGVKNLTVFSDSELIVKQMNGEYRVKNTDLQELYAEATALKKKLPKVTLTHVRRAQNADADRLCNEALDGNPKRWEGSLGSGQRAAGSQPSERPTVHRPLPTAHSSPPALRLDALAILEAAAEAWAANGPKNPSPDDVWNSLWKSIAKHTAPPPAPSPPDEHDSPF